MNLQPSVAAALRAQLVALDSLDDQIQALTAPIEAVQAAAARLRDRIADLDRQIAAPATQPIPVDTQRLEALIAGADVPPIDKTAIEPKAARNRALMADRHQITVDLSAVEGRLGQLNTQAADLRQQRAAAERTFIVAFYDALSEAYRQDIVEFIATHVPPLLSVGFKVRELTGKLPDWHANIMTGLSVTWPDPTYERATPQSFPRPLNVWPRMDDTLVSGEPSSSPEIVERLVAAIRGTAPSPGKRAAANR
jgi:hypothetical protein